MPNFESKLRDHRKRAVDAGHWALVSALDGMLVDVASLDAKVNVVGAMHEIGLLPNSIKPFWSEWRSSVAERDAWVSRCLDRQQHGDSDYWAIVGLLGLPLDCVQQALSQRSYKLINIRYADSFKDGRCHIAVLAGKHQESILAPVVEIGWGAEKTVIEASRWRAVILDEQTENSGSLTGTGTGSHFLRAKLPYGCWRVRDEAFELRSEWTVNKSETPFKDYA